MMDRERCLKKLAAIIKDEIVVATYSAAHAWIAIADRPLNYFSFGAMGLASSHGLGLALAHPDRRVIVLDGDGSLLMNLGTLVTIAAAAPRNFTHLLWRNGSYEANGGHPIPNREVDFCGMARSAGIKTVDKIADHEDFDGRIKSIIHAPGPVFAEMTIEQGPIGPRSYEDMYKPERRAAFRAALRA